jgi:hypothetical protein
MKVYSPVPAATGVTALRETSNVDVRIVGVLDDNLDPPLMDELVKVLRDELGDHEVKLWLKPIGTAPAPESLIEEMAKEVHVAITGVGM